MIIYWLATKERTRGFVERSLESDEASKGRPRHLEAQYNSTSGPPPSLGAVCLRLDAQATYGVRFPRSTYGWKDNFIELPMESSPRPNDAWVNGNHRIKWTSRICLGAALPCFGLLVRVLYWSPLGCVQGSCTLLNTLYSVELLKLGFEFCLDYSIKNSFAVHRFVRP
jgi:hypothetical protein